jgi:hypothetical protein
MYPEDEREPADDPAAQTERRIGVSPQRRDRTAQRGAIRSTSQIPQPILVTWFPSEAGTRR